jgi:3-hydroxybutyryl-CoA dehydrogenase
MDKETICVVGGGIMGRGIAYVAALGGYRVHLVDVTEEQIKKATEEIERSLDAGRARGKVDDDTAREALARIVPFTDLRQASAPAFCVIEAVPEFIELKLDTFGKLNDYCDRSAILASNTSALSITEIAASVDAPERVVGMHFFDPVPKMKLLEIVRGLETSDEAVESTVNIARRMAKEPVVINESPGFITTRMNALIGNEAFYMLQEGVATALEIDQALKLGLNHPMGPFEMVDLVGLDTRLSILKYLHSVLGEKYRPCPLMEKYVKAGRLGRKAGKGVYDYTKS